MRRKKSTAVLKGNGPVPQDTYGLLGGITMEVRRIMSEALEKSFDTFYGLRPGNPKETKATKRLAGLE